MTYITMDAGLKGLIKFNFCDMNVFTIYHYIMHSTKIGDLNDVTQLLIYMSVFRILNECVWNRATVLTVMSNNSSVTHAVLTLRSDWLVTSLLWLSVLSFISAAGTVEAALTSVRTTRPPVSTPTSLPRSAGVSTGGSLGVPVS